MVVLGGGNVNIDFSLLLRILSIINLILQRRGFFRTQSVRSDLIIIDESGTPRESGVKYVGPLNFSIVGLLFQAT